MIQTGTWTNGVGGTIIIYGPDGSQVDGNSRNGNSRNVNGSNGLNQSEQNELQNGLTGRTTNPSKKQYDRAISRLMDQFCESVYRWGTDDEAMEDVLSRIDSDNILDMVKAWNKYHSAEYGESFFEAFSKDASRSQLREYSKQMALALRDRAEEVGCMDEEMARDFAKIDKNFRPGFLGICWRQGGMIGIHTDDNYKILERIAQRIIEAEAKALSEKQSTEEDKQKVYKEETKFAKPFSENA